MKALTICQPYAELIARGEAPAARSAARSRRMSTKRASLRTASTHPPAPPPPLYFRTVEDFHRLPVEKLRACLEDFFLWLVMCRAVAPGLDGIAHVKDVNTFGWVDDGRHDANFHVKLVPAPTGLSVSVTGAAGTEQSCTWSADDLEQAAARTQDDHAEARS